MKQKNERQFAGVCINNSHAIIIATGEDQETGSYEILEKIDADGSHVSDSEHTRNNAKRADSIKYFKAISGHLLHYDEILLFGTGQSQEQLHNFLKEDQHFNTKQITVDSSENLTDPQMIAKVRDFFKS